MSDTFFPLDWDTGMHKGSFFATYANPDVVETVVNYPVHMMHGEFLSVERATEVKKGGPRPGTYPGEGSHNRIFISKIPYDAKKEEVQAYFLQYGEWIDFFMPWGNFIESHKGLCFITYVDAASVTKAIEASPHELRGHTVVVDVATAREVVPKGKLHVKGAGRGNNLGKGIVLPAPWSNAPVTLPGTLALGAYAANAAKAALAANAALPWAGVGAAAGTNLQQLAAAMGIMLPGVGSITLPSAGSITFPSDWGITLPSAGGITLPSAGGVTLPSAGDFNLVNASASMDTTMPGVGGMMPGFQGVAGGFTMPAASNDFSSMLGMTDFAAVAPSAGGFAEMGAATGSMIGQYGAGGKGHINISWPQQSGYQPY